MALLMIIKKMYIPIAISCMHSDTDTELQSLSLTWFSSVSECVQDIAIGIYIYYIYHH